MPSLLPEKALSEHQIWLIGDRCDTFLAQRLIRSFWCAFFRFIQKKAPQPFLQHRKDNLESMLRKGLIDNDFLRHWTLDKED